MLSRGLTVNTEIFVADDFQHSGIATALLRRHLELGREKFNAVGLDAEIYDNGVNFPIGWYERLGFSRAPLIPIVCNIEEVLAILRAKK